MRKENNFKPNNIFIKLRTEQKEETQKLNLIDKGINLWKQFNEPFSEDVQKVIEENKIKYPQNFIH